jgi:putative flippase GtrA
MTLSPRQLSRRLRQAWEDGAVLLKAISFGLIGVVNFIVDFSIFSFGYYYLELPIIASNLLSWTVAVTGSYVMNSMITFAAESGRKLRAKKYAGFVLMQTLGLVANTTTVVVASYFVPVLVGKVFAVGASFVVNFSLTHFVVFRKRHDGLR